MTQDLLAEFSTSFEALKPTFPLVIAVSGGPDSMALLRLVLQWAENQKQPVEIVAVTVNHGLRPEAKSEAAQVKAWVEALGVEHHVLTWGAVKPSSNIQAAARDARYLMLCEFCNRRGSSCLATAHHLDDQAETFLMRLIRGSGVDGLASMAAERELNDCTPPIRLVRPLLSIERARLVSMLELLGQDWAHDPSNEDTKYDRVKLRKLQETFDSFGLGRARLIETSNRMSQAREALEFYCTELFSRAVRIYPAGYATLDREALLTAPSEIGLRCLSKCLRAVSGAPYGPRYERLSRLYQALSAAEFDGQTLHGCQLMSHQGAILIFRELRAVDPVPLNVPAHGQALWDHRFWVGQGQGTRVTDRSVPSLQVRALSHEGLNQIRTRQDEMGLLGSLPVGLAHSLPALWQDQQVVFVPFGLYDGEEGLYPEVSDITFRLRMGS